MRIVVKYSIAFWQYSTAVLVGGLDKLVHCVRFFRQPLIFQPQYRNVTTYQSKWGQNQSITYGKIEQRLRSKTTADDQFAAGSILLDQRKVKNWRPFSQFVGNGNLTLVSKWMYVKGSGWTPLQKPAFQFFNNFTFAFFWKVLFFSLLSSIVLQKCRIHLLQYYCWERWRKGEIDNSMIYGRYSSCSSEGSSLFYFVAAQRNEAHDKKQFAAKTHKPNTECRRIFATISSAALSRQKFFYLSE